MLAIVLTILQLIMLVIFFIMEIECAKDYIDNAKTIDASPVTHAHWVRVARSENEYWQCSNCHGYFTLPMPKYRGFYMRYCGCCGAEMDEVTE